jgi:glutaredoxin
MSQSHDIQEVTESTLPEVLSQTLTVQKPFKIAKTLPECPRKRVIHVHYKRGCPYTRKMLELMLQLPYSVEYQMVPYDLPGVREILSKYLRKDVFTYPQVFVRGESIGGATEAAEVLPRLTEKEG